MFALKDQPVRINQAIVNIYGLATKTVDDLIFMSLEIAAEEAINLK